MQVQGHFLEEVVFVPLSPHGMIAPNSNTISAIFIINRASDTGRGETQLHADNCCDQNKNTIWCSTSCGEC